MKVYLAGELKRGDYEHWRHQLTVGKCDRVVTGFWEPLKKALIGRFDYTGPYVPVEQVEDPEIPGFRFEEAELRVAAIKCSDLVFAWEPDALARWELGVAHGAGVKTGVAARSETWFEHMRMKKFGVDFLFTAPAPPMALLEIAREVEMSGHFFNGVWRKLTSRYINTCFICGDETDVGEDIMWRKENEEAKGGDVCHVECFVLNAPHKKMDKDLQALGMELLRNRVRALETENSRLVETIQDLA